MNAASLVALKPRKIHGHAALSGEPRLWQVGWKPIVGPQSPRKGERDDRRFRRTAPARTRQAQGPEFEVGDLP